MFSAYVAVVNGIQSTIFSNVTIEIRLQTSNAAYDLNDERPPTSEVKRTLNPGESVDVIVKHPLNELGTHTMRVSVQYFDNRLNEPKTLRKFYRFNVLNALNIKSKCVKMKGKFMVQCLVSNATKAPVYLKEVLYCF